MTTCLIERNLRSSASIADDELRRLARQATNSRNGPTRQAKLLEKIAEAKKERARAREVLEDHHASHGC